MTEAEWLASEDPAAMLAWLGDKASDRKLRLFVEACRATWPWEARRGLPADLDSVELVWALRNWVHHPPEPARAAAILRDLIGNPWRPVTLPRGWLTADVVSLAEAAYEYRLDDGTLNPDRLAVLSDALEEAGCPQESRHLVQCWSCRGTGFVRDNRGPVSCIVCSQTGRIERQSTNPLLANLRSPGPHYRGCWALDIILGKS